MFRLSEWNKLSQRRVSETKMQTVNKDVEVLRRLQSGHITIP